MCELSTMIVCVSRVLSTDKEKNMHNKKMICGIVAALCVVVAIIVYYLSGDTKDKSNNIGFTEENLATTAEYSQSHEDVMIYVYVCGQVMNPGVVCVSEGSRIVDVINLAGGMTDLADINAINQAEFVQDGQKIYVPAMGEKIVVSSSGDGKININTAGEEQLMTLPGIGQSKASAIISYRKENGGFNMIEDIMNIPGIKTSAFNKIKDYICV